MCKTGQKISSWGRNRHVLTCRGTIYYFLFSHLPSLAATLYSCFYAQYHSLYTLVGRQQICPRVLTDIQGVSEEDTITRRGNSPKDTLYDPQWQGHAAAAAASGLIYDLIMHLHIGVGIG